MSGRDPAGRLARALAASGGPGFIVHDARSRPWASATFTGERVTLGLSCAADPALPAWLESLPEADLPMPGWYLADLCVRSVECDAEAVSVFLDALVLQSA